jgi:hypothetical protein
MDFVNKSTWSMSVRESAPKPTTRAMDGKCKICIACMTMKGTDDKEILCHVPDRNLFELLRIQ